MAKVYNPDGTEVREMYSGTGPVAEAAKKAVAAVTPAPTEPAAVSAQAKLNAERLANFQRVNSPPVDAPPRPAGAPEVPRAFNNPPTAAPPAGTITIPPGGVKPAPSHVVGGPQNLTPQPVVAPEANTGLFSVDGNKSVRATLGTTFAKGVMDSSKKTGGGEYTADSSDPSKLGNAVLLGKGATAYATPKFDRGVAANLGATGSTSKNDWSAGSANDALVTRRALLADQVAEATRNNKITADYEANKSVAQRQVDLERGNTTWDQGNTVSQNQAGRVNPLQVAAQKDFDAAQKRATDDKIAAASAYKANQDYAGNAATARGLLEAKRMEIEGNIKTTGMKSQSDLERIKAAGSDKVDANTRYKAAHSDLQAEDKAITDMEQLAGKDKAKLAEVRKRRAALAKKREALAA